MIPGYYYTALARARYCEAFLAAAAPTIAVTVSITNASTAATLATVSSALQYGGVYGIAAILSQAATATNATAAATLSPT